ncbi:parafibromin isoform X2 [Folsomia candida]|uniref:parafibromin isoform X2 n=1 Tax=Folsomia candida TaxID=158441 RepID=UPI001604AA5A|nr:parafibromin isoform X2 [Folsomia candida]
MYTSQPVKAEPEEEDEKTGTDPLMVLRHFTVHRKEIVETEEYLIFDKIAYLKNAKTNFPMKSWKINSAKKDDNDPSELDNKGVNDELDRNKNDYYNVGSLKYFLDNVDLLHPTYVRQAAHDMSEMPYLQVVTRVDRFPLLEYLQGRRTKCEGADTVGPIQLPIPAPKLERRDSWNECNSPPTNNPNDQATNPCVVKKEHNDDSLLTCPSNRDSVLYGHQLPNPVELFSADASKNVTKSLSELEIVQNKVLPIQKPGMEDEKRVDLKNSIVDAIGSDKILELKAKRRAVKVQKVKGVSDMELDDVGTNKPSFGGTQESNNFSHERVYLDRSSILRSNKINFLSNVTSILESIKAREERVKKFGPAALMATPKNISHTTAPTFSEQPVVETVPYSRYDQVAKLPLETAEFGINPLETFSKGLGLVAGVKKTMAMVDNKKKTTAPLPLATPPAKKMRHDHATPIIIVPDCTPSILTILNAKDMLEDGIFIPHEEKKSLGAKKMNEVVAVFITGKAWQFKGWPFNANPVEICTQLNAFHLKYDDTEAETNIKQWPVKVMNINRRRRHLDKACTVLFWSSVEEFIAKNKPFLDY